jgi:hypothetical protein
MDADVSKAHDAEQTRLELIRNVDHDNWSLPIQSLSPQKESLALIRKEFTKHSTIIFRICGACEDLVIWRINVELAPGAFTSDGCIPRVSMSQLSDTS